MTFNERADLICFIVVFDGKRPDICVGEANETQRRCQKATSCDGVMNSDEVLIRRLVSCASFVIVSVLAKVEASRFIAMGSLTDTAGNQHQRTTIKLQVK